MKIGALEAAADAVTVARSYIFGTKKQLEKDDFPSLPSIPILGNIIDFYSQNRTKAIDAVGGVVWGKLPGIGKVLVLLDPLVIKKVLSNGVDNIVAIGADKPNEFLGPNTVLGMMGKQHRKVRSLCGKAISKSALRFYFDDIKNLTIKTAEEISAASIFKSGGIDPTEHFEQYAFLTMCSFMAASHSKDRKILENLFPQYKEFSRGIMLSAMPSWMGFSGAVNKGLTARTFIIETVKIIAAERRVAMDAGEEFVDALSAFISSRDSEGNSLTDEEIANLFLLMQFAGFETTSKTLTTLLYHLTHLLPADDLERLHDEVSQPNALESEQSLSSLPILDAFIKESMRLLPTSPMSTRVFKDDIEVEGKIIKAGTAVVSFRDKSSWLGVENAEKFDISRFLGENPFDKTNPAEFTPFGTGERMCLGFHLARMETKLFIAVAVREYDIKSIGNKLTSGYFPIQYTRGTIRMKKIV
ncbi:hypothetical protein HK100_012518 [Physocladia obscura]|uniref:Cytochrome P450 n=1 Tax=Physocladia obscura TaxID=109957 RepID=A0AAD5T1D9_9FUNG|nr:hypothetical protein HK100_012518 [Physocladia obscura]